MFVEMARVEQIAGKHGVVLGDVTHGNVEITALLDHSLKRRRNG